MLDKYYGKKVIILIDEYDTPLTSTYMSSYYEKAISFFRNLLSAAFKDNEYLEFGLLTGVMKSIYFLGLNNLEVSTVLNENFKHFIRTI